MLTFLLLTVLWHALSYLQIIDGPVLTRNRIFYVELFIWQVLTRLLVAVSIAVLGGRLKALQRYRNVGNLPLSDFSIGLALVRDATAMLRYLTLARGDPWIRFLVVCVSDRELKYIFRTGILCLSV